MIARIGRKGTTVTRSPKRKTRSFCPGRIPSDSRTSFGITIWYFDETVTTDMALLGSPICRSIIVSLNGGMSTWSPLNETIR